MKVVDSCTFFNEIHMLELRLAMLGETVDIFVIAEMSVTHGGLYKGFVLDAYLDKLPVPRDRIAYVKIDDPPKVDHRIESERWVLENFQRNGIARGLASLGLDDDDVVLVSDLDELPDPKAIRLAIGGLQSHKYGVFCQLHRKFFINAIADEYRTGQCWLGTTVTRAGVLTRSSPQDLRRGPGFPRAAYLWTVGRADDTFYVDRGGWHLTYFGGARSVDVKVQSIVEGRQAHAAVDFLVPARSRHNWRDGRTQAVSAWRDDLDATIAKVDALAAEPLAYVPAPVHADPMHWEWLWWYDKPIDAAAPHVTAVA